jgi:drug/metabolite transporter (DMT)-like permease
VLVTTMPLWLVALDATLYRGPRPRPWQVVGLLAGFAGVVILVDPGAGATSALGALALLLAAFSWANGALLSRTADLPKSPWMATALQMLGGGVLLLITATVRGDWQRFDVAAVSMRSVAAMIYLIFAGSILAFSAFVYLMRVRPAAEVSTYAFVNPVIALVLGWLVGETFGARAWVGSALIVGAVVLIHRARQRRPAAEVESAPEVDLATAATATAACEAAQ